jgi:cytoskeletal protein RodZ
MKFPSFKFVIIFITVIILLEAVIGAMFYFLRSSGLKDSSLNPQKGTPVPVQTEEPGQGSNWTKTPTSTENNSKETQASVQTGETGQESIPTKTSASTERTPYNSNIPKLSTSFQGPPAASITSNIAYGSVVSIQPDGITIMSDGSSFEDRKAREIIIRFDQSTVVLEEDKTIRYTGMAGLEYLSVGDQVSVESSQNINGKTEFIATYVSK